MIPQTVELRLPGKQPHRISIPVEWSGGLAIVVNVNRGNPSGKILIGRLASVILVPDGDERGPRLESGGSPAVGGAQQEATHGGQEEAPEGVQG